MLRAEVEWARLRSQQQALVADSRAMEVMLNMSMGGALDAIVPVLSLPNLLVEPPSLQRVSEQALNWRPELRAGQADISKSAAEVEAMRAMYAPMGVVRIGAASTMSEGAGVMAMVGISIPLWRDRLRAGVAEARAMETMAHADLLAMQRMAMTEAMVARERVIAAQATFRALRDEVVPRARLALEPALAGYAAGTVPGYRTNKAPFR